MVSELENKIAQLRAIHLNGVKRLQSWYRSSYYRILRYVHPRHRYQRINGLRNYYRNKLNQLQIKLNNDISYYTKLLSAPAVALTKGIKKALLIACNYRGTDNELRGCINDANNLKSKLETTYDFKNITVLSDDTGLKSTAINIINELRKLLDNSNPGDTLFVSFSGHGTHMKDTSGDEKDGRDEMFVTLDNQCIRDDELKLFVQTKLKKDVKLFMLFDCCHSGSILDLNYQYLDSENSGNATITGNKETVGEAYMVSGCMDKQTSADAFLRGKYQGAMTRAFIDVLNKDSDISWKNLINNMRLNLKRGRFHQIPQLSSGRKLDLDTKICL